MGHDLPEALWADIIGEVTDHARRAAKETLR
jgi:5'-deoxynucleotidase YfbR-like HD superfamily hydrolase